MLEEIAQQPEALARTIAEERGKVARLGQRLRAHDIDLIVLVARGSSDNAALFGRYLLEITTGIPVALAAPSVNTLYGARLRLDRALVVAVSQSGEGDDINRVLEMARAAGACCTVGITNEPDSSMTNFVDETLLTHGGRERSVAATKTYTGQLLHFYMLAEALAGGGVKLGYEAIPDYAARALKLRTEVEQLVERYVFMENCVVVGRGLIDRKSTRLNSSHANISYAVFCLKKKNNKYRARYLLEQLGLTGEESPASISGGEARRAALARVLAHSPDI